MDEPTPTLTVTELTLAIKTRLEKGFPTVLVQGEISNFKRHSSGHLYFSLKDSSAQMAAVMWKTSVTRLSSLPKNGDQVLLRGRLTVYPPQGNYQLVVDHIEPLGLGELLLRFQQLKETLAKRGWFDSERKKPLPRFPKTIGVVTSPTGAVIQDILHVLQRRFSGFHLILNPVRVQGPGAAEEIARAIYQFNAYDLADLLIVGRGGGSIEDLWPFNEEMVAEAIFHSHIPIISAVGHETDTTIADFVADVRAPTPSAAAEMAIAEKAHHLAFLVQSQTRLQQVLVLRLRAFRQHLVSLARHPFLISPESLLGKYWQHSDWMRLRLDQSIQKRLEYFQHRLEAFRRQTFALKPTAQIAFWKQKLDSMRKELDRSGKKLCQDRRDRLTALSCHLASIDPKNLLEKGYSILFSETTGSVIVRTTDVDLATSVRAIVSDGEILLQPLSMKPR